MKNTIIRTAGRLTAALFLAAVLTTAFVAAQEAQAPPPAEKAPPARMLPREALGLTPEQEKALGEFRKARMEERQAFRDEMMKIREEMRSLARDPKANEAKINGLIDKRARLQAERAKAGFKNRAVVEKIFTPGQLEKMKAFRARLRDRPGLAGPGRIGRMGLDRMGLRGQGMGRFRGARLGARPHARLRALRHRPFFRWRRW